MENQDFNQDKTYQHLKSELDSLMKRVNAVTEAMKAYRRGFGYQDADEIADHGKNPPKPYPDYPYESELIDKVRYLESTEPFLRTFWKRTEMENEIKKIEGKNTKALNSIQVNFNKYFKAKRLVRVKYNGSNIKVFYTTSPEWLEQGEKAGKFTPIYEHCHPEMKRMPERERKDGVWTGI